MVFLLLAVSVTALYPIFLCIAFLPGDGGTIERASIGVFIKQKESIGVCRFWVIGEYSIGGFFPFISSSSSSFIQFQMALWPKRSCLCRTTPKLILFLIMLLWTWNFKFSIMIGFHNHYIVVDSFLCIFLSLIPFLPGASLSISLFFHSIIILSEFGSCFLNTPLMHRASIQIETSPHICLNVLCVVVVVAFFVRFDVVWAHSRSNKIFYFVSIFDMLIFRVMMISWAHQKNSSPNWKWTIF